MKNFLVILGLALGLVACSSTKPTLTVTGKEYIYPTFAPEWLTPCIPPRIPVRLGVEADVTTNRVFMIYVTDLISALDKCNAKLTSIRNANSKFQKRLNDLQPKAEPEDQPN